MRKKSFGSYDYVKAKFTKYLDDNNKRKTLDRFTILEQAYNMNGHFDIDQLYNKMKKSRFRVSRATLYNTLSLLIDCGFVMKYQFPNKDILYEFVMKNDGDSHYHLYNLETKEIVKFDDKRFEKIFKDVEKKYDVDIINCNIVLYCKNKKKEGIENE